MLEILILGVSGVVAVASPFGPARTTPERPDEARAAFPQADVRARSTFDPSVNEAPERSGTVCAIRVVRADPRVDPGIVRAVERPVDREMVVPSVCAR